MDSAELDLSHSQPHRPWFSFHIHLLNFLCIFMSFSVFVSHKVAVMLAENKGSGYRGLDLELVFIEGTFSDSACATAIVRASVPLSVPLALGSGWSGMTTKLGT